MLSAVVERLLKALREARPTTVRQFFALACQHTRWELNDLARRLDTQPRAVEVLEKTNTPEARQVLQTLADGAPGALATRQARAALDRKK